MLIKKKIVIKKNILLSILFIFILNSKIHCAETEEFDQDALFNTYCNEVSEKLQMLYPLKFGGEEYRRCKDELVATLIDTAFYSMYKKILKKFGPTLKKIVNESYSNNIEKLK